MVTIHAPFSTATNTPLAQHNTHYTPHYTFTHTPHHTTPPHKTPPMSKERMNITVDDDVKRRLKAREDINASGAANKFYKALLRGEDSDKAAKRVEIEQLRSEAQDLEEQAESLRKEADAIERELEQREKEEKQEIRQVVEQLEVGTPDLRSASDEEIVVKDNDQRIEYLANEVGVSPNELKKRAKEQYKDNNNDPSYR